MRSVLALAFVLLVTPCALACSCAGGGGPACQEAWSKYTSAVFLGKVVRIEAESGLISSLASVLGMTPMGTRNRVDFEIEEPFLNISGKQVTVWTSASEAACGYKFVKGERYVVYAGGGIGGLVVSLCSHTRPAKYAEDDIQYFHSLSALPSTSSILGSVWRYTHDPNFKPKFQPSIMDHYRPPEQEYIAMVPFPGITVVAKGEDGLEHSTEVGSDGSWKISGLAPGSYVVEPHVKDEIFVHPYWHKVEIAPKGCARVDIRVENNGRITGVLTHGRRGNDWAVLKMFALPASKPDLRHPTLEIYIELEQSSFELAPLPAGKYIMGVYLSKKVPAGPGAHTFRDVAPTYYPGVLNIKAATVIEVHEGEKLSGFNFPMFDTEFLPDTWRCEICDK